MSNADLITKFYTAFSKKDYRKMQSCYHPDGATFTDAVFSLDGAQVNAMWEMLVTAGKDLHVDFKNVTAEGDIGSAEWEARYTFSRTGKMVVNRIRAEFVFKDGMIIRHKDHFNFYKWARQAFGVTGLVLGWTSFFKRRVMLSAQQNLDKFMGKIKDGS